MKIKETRGLTPEEVDRIQAERAKFDQAAKLAENKKFLGNLRKPVQVNPNNRFHLPVLHINDPQQWPSQPLESRLHFTDEVAFKTCLGNCCGVQDLKAGCCYLDPDDMEHVLGPLDEDWIKEIVAWLRTKGIQATRSDVVIDFEEGKVIGEKFFTGHRKAVFLSQDSYPILRFQVVGPRFACKFLNPLSGKCSIYEKRPDMCRGYLCQYVKANFLVRTADRPNTYKKLR